MFENNDNEIPDPKKLPVYQKAMEIHEIINMMTEYLNDELKTEPDNKSYKIAESIIDQLRENSILIPAKIAGAVGADIYDIKMENATLIRKAAREISVNCSGLDMVELGDVDYLNMLKGEIEEFRVLFAEWVATFDPWDYIIDRWGLFNPPGVNYDDHDPDDDLPPTDAPML